MKIRWLAIWALTWWNTALPATPAPMELTIYADAYPPFIQHEGGLLNGPYIEAFTQLAAKQGIRVHYQPMPIKRVMKLIATQQNSCGLAVYFAPGEAETLSYVARVAPITLAVYARRGEVGKLYNIEALRNYRVGAMDVSELNELLDNAAIHYEPLAKTAKGIAMLQAGRFELLVTDVLPELVLSSQTGPKIERVMILARVERWLACHPQLPVTELNALRQAMHDGVFADSVANIWQHYGLSPVYDEVRREWGIPH